MHYLIALPLWLLFVVWIVRSASTSNDGTRAEGRLARKGWLVLGSVAAVVVVLIGAEFGGSALFGPERDADRAPWPAPAQVAARLPVPMPLQQTTQVKLKAVANVRAAPSGAAQVLRVAHQGDVLTSFGGSNGWVQVGVTRPEGWVAASATAPAS